MKYIKIASITAIFAVLIGAFGAHGLNDVLVQNQRLGTFDTAVKYHFYHVLAMFIVSLLMRDNPSKYLILAFKLFFLGIIFFSGSLYILSITNIGWFGAITPIGGLLFIVAWMYVFLAARNEQRKR